MAVYNTIYCAFKMQNNSLYFQKKKINKPVITVKYKTIYL